MWNQFEFVEHFVWRQQGIELTNSQTGPDFFSVSCTKSYIHCWQLTKPVRLTDFTCVSINGEMGMKLYG